MGFTSGPDNPSTQRAAVVASRPRWLHKRYEGESHLRKLGRNAEQRATQAELARARAANSQTNNLKRAASSAADVVLDQANAPRSEDSVRLIGLQLALLPGEPAVKKAALAASLGLLVDGANWPAARPLSAEVDRVLAGRVTGAIHGSLDDAIAPSLVGNGSLRSVTAVRAVLPARAVLLASALTPPRADARPAAHWWRTALHQPLERHDADAERAVHNCAIYHQ